MAEVIANYKTDSRVKLAPGDKLAIARLHRDGESIVDLAERYDVSTKTIQRTLGMDWAKKAQNMKCDDAESVVDYIPHGDLPKGKTIRAEERALEIIKQERAQGEYISQGARLLTLGHDLISGAAIASSNSKRLHALAQARIDRIEQQLMDAGGADSVRCFVSAEDDDAVKLMRPVMAAITAANAAAQAGTDLLRLNIDAVRSSEQALSGGAGNDIPRVEIVFKSPRAKE